MAEEQDPKRRSEGYRFTDQTEVVVCPNNKEHGRCEPFRSQKGDIFHRCNSCLSDKPGDYFGKPVLICKDGESKNQRGKKRPAASSTFGGEKKQAPPSQSGQILVDFERYVRQTLEDIQKKTDQMYAMCLAAEGKKPVTDPEASQLPDS